GATGIGSRPIPTPTPRGGMGYYLTATETAHALTMHVGQKLELAPHATKGMNDWSHPVSSDPSTLEATVDPAAMAARGVTLAAFVAKNAGVAKITSNAGPKCSPNMACPAYLAVYSLTVTVTP